MGPQYQATVDSYAASPQAASPQQAVQSPGNQTLGKALEQSPVHGGFGTSSGMYDNGMDVSAQPAPVASPPQPQNQPATAGVNPSWAQQGRKRGGRAKRADGGGLAAFGGGPISPLMMTGDTIAALGGYRQPQVGAMGAGPAPGAPMSINGAAPVATPYNSGAPTQRVPDTYHGQYQFTPNTLYDRGLSNADFVNLAYRENLNRDPEAGAMDAWLNALNNGQMTQRDAERMFLTSPEYQSNSRALNEAQSARMNTPEYRQMMLAQGITPDAPGTIDPFISGYNARMANAQSAYGGLAQQNYAATQAQQQAYQQELEKVRQNNAARLEAAKQQKAKQDADAQAAQQQALLMMMMMR